LLLLLVCYARALDSHILSAALDFCASSLLLPLLLLMLLLLTCASRALETFKKKWR